MGDNQSQNMKKNNSTSRDEEPVERGHIILSQKVKDSIP